jgi:hypothetical protein
MNGPFRSIRTKLAPSATSRSLKPKKPSVAIVLGVLALSLGACSGVARIEREGERCRDLDLEAVARGDTPVEGATARPPKSYDPRGCFDDSVWLTVAYREEVDGSRHTFVAEVSVRPLDEEEATEITADNRIEALWGFAEACVEATRSDPRCVDLVAVPSERSIPGLDCVGWDEQWSDVEVRGAEGEEWPFRARTIACFDSQQPPTRIAVLRWSERHPPSVAGLSEQEVDEHSTAFLASLAFSPTP